MNELLNLQLELDLAKQNLELLIQKGMATDEDYEHIEWLEMEVARLL
jgi:hypothetical protein